MEVRGGRDRGRRREEGEREGEEREEGERGGMEKVKKGERN